MSFPELPVGCLTESSLKQKKVLVTWEHEEILYIESHDDCSTVVLVNPSICTKGGLYPSEAFTKQFNKLKKLLEKCQTGELLFVDLLKKIGFEENKVDSFSSLKYLFL